MFSLLSQNCNSKLLMLIFDYVRVNQLANSEWKGSEYIFRSPLFVQPTAAQYYLTTQKAQSNKQRCFKILILQSAVDVSSLEAFQHLQLFQKFIFERPIIRQIDKTFHEFEEGLQCSSRRYFFDGVISKSILCMPLISSCLVAINAVRVICSCHRDHLFCLPLTQ